MAKGSWALRLGVWLLHVVTLSAFFAAMLAAGFLLAQNVSQQRVEARRTDKEDIKTLEQRIAEPQGHNSVQ